VLYLHDAMAGPAAGGNSRSFSYQPCLMPRILLNKIHQLDIGKAISDAIAKAKAEQKDQ
jgi:hypothetical protein